MPESHLFYDPNDYKLLDVLNDILNRKLDHSQFKTFLMPYLKPHGIKELAAPQSIRIAFAIMHLLGSLESEKATERVKALKALRDEVLTTARGSMRNNRARVLIQIVKELVRAQGDRQLQLELAHDFRTAALGKTRFLRDQLRKYHLLEMPEEWNQISFDDRVHDANSSGRKSATHLIMDAWVKGIRNLRVVYYNYVDPAVVSELFASAQILGISARIGIEFRAVFRGRFIKLIWDPSGLQDDADIESFFKREAVSQLMTQGREVQAYRACYVQAAAEAFNAVHRKSIFQEFGVQLPPIDYVGVARSVGTGNPSLVHLGKCIYEVALPIIREHGEALAKEYASADADRRVAIAMQLESLNSFDADTFVARYLLPKENPNLANPNIPLTDGSGPALLRLSPGELTIRLRQAYHASRITLILADLKLEDAIELLYDCEGRITHFEMFNLTTMTDMQVLRRKPLSELQQAINGQNAVMLKRMIRGCIEQVSRKDTDEAADRVQKLSEILQHFNMLRSYYKETALKTKIGSGSTGSSSRTHGMGFAVAETLPVRTQREVCNKHVKECIPVSANATQVVEFLPPPRKKGVVSLFVQRAGRLPVLRNLICQKKNSWNADEFNVDDSVCGNVITLGGGRIEADNGLRLQSERVEQKRRPSLGYLNSNLKNLFRVLIGFIPAFLAFYLTKEWWVLAYFGGVLWFSITGIRNIIQSVLGGGGLRRSPSLRWNDYISWSRISESLLYTGFSVPLLDWLCKTVLLDKGFDINTTTNPVLLYTIMAITNGIYITSHNLFRGLPKEAALANFFRSIFSIPIALAFNYGIFLLMSLYGASDIDGQLQLWAAVISKLASDCVAGIIEGLADRKHNIAMRHWDYSEKLKQVFEVFSRMEIFFPRRDMLKVLNNPDELVEMTGETEANFVQVLIANALDLLYIKMYQPRATEALRHAMSSMTRDELDIFMASQRILGQEREIARLFVDGLVGQNFSAALSFYLIRHKEYFRDVERLAAQVHPA